MIKLFYVLVAPTSQIFRYVRESSQSGDEETLNCVDANTMLDDITRALGLSQLSPALISVYGVLGLNEINTS